MKYFFFPFFLIRLSLALFPTLVRLGLARFQWYALAGSLLFFLGSLLSTAHLFAFPLSPTLAVPETPTQITSSLEGKTSNTYIVPLATTSLNQELAQLHTLEQTQPLHRDVLLNLSLIYRALGSSEKAEKYFQQARQLDPNSPIFSE